jgi:hypothetical protein
MLNRASNRARYGKTSLPEQTRRRVDQDALALARVGRPGIEQVHETAVVRHVLGRDLGVRPIAAPDQAFGIGAHKRVVEGTRVGIIGNLSDSR